MGYESLGWDYISLGELTLASEYYAKAFELRNSASEGERLWISEAYCWFVTWALEKAAVVSQQMIASLSGDLYVPHSWMSLIVPSSIRTGLSLRGARHGSEALHH